MPNRAMYANLVEFQIKFYLHYLLQFLRSNRELISQKHKLLFRSKVMKEEQVAFSFWVYAIFHQVASLPNLEGGKSKGLLGYLSLCQYYHKAWQKTMN